MKFQVTQNAQVEGIRYYRGPGNDGTHVGHVWDSGGTLLAEVTFGGESATGWQYAPLSQPLVLVPGAVYVVSYVAPVGRYAVSGGYFDAGPVSSGPIVGLANVAGNGNGVYRLRRRLPHGDVRRRQLLGRRRRQGDVIPPPRRDQRRPFRSSTESGNRCS